ncbi:MAG: protein kinase family protein [Streptosporangiaceae bacterium]
MSTFISEPGTRLGGRYRLEDRVAGAAGWVAWKAIDETLARAVTVVTFAHGFPRVTEVLTAARAASRLTDARLAQVFDVEDTWDNAYVVMEWPAGETLDDLLSAGPIEPVAGARIIAEAASALSVAHAAGVAHLCLTPESLRWTSGGGVKVTGIGTDAALSGTTAEDPAMADTLSLGRLLYAALTGLWPGTDYPALPIAPFTEGHPRRPRQVRAGVPAALDDITCRAMGLTGHDGDPIRTLDQLARAISAELPPEEIPPAGPRDSRRSAPRQADDRDYWPAGPASSGRAQEHDPARQPGGGQAGRIVLIVVLVLAVVAGAGLVADKLLHRGAPAQPAAVRHGTVRGGAIVLTPVTAHGFDALNLADTHNENDDQARNAIDGDPRGWSSQEYATASLGNLKAGTGLILDMGKPVRLSSITVQFGQAPGADVQIKMGTSPTRSEDNLASMRTVASADNISGTHTFQATSDAVGQYVVIWFTRLPPTSTGTFMAQILSIIVRGTATSS